MYIFLQYYLMENIEIIALFHLADDFTILKKFHGHVLQNHRRIEIKLSLWTLNISFSKILFRLIKSLLHATFHPYSFSKYFQLF